MRAFPVLLVAVFGLGLGLGAAPQRNTPLRDPGDTAIIMPFAFQPRRAPSGQFKSDQFDAWLRAVRTHQPGQLDAAAFGQAVLTSQALSDMVAGFERQVVKKKDWTERIETAKRAVLLHTDIAVDAARIGHLDEMNESLRASLHLGAAMELVGYLQMQQARKTRDPFAANWWLAVAALLGEHREPVSAILFMRRALVQVPGDAAMLLMAGALRELLASPLVLVDSESEAGEELKAWRGTPAGNLHEAERLYREALEADPAMTEARLRLGRVLEQQGRYDAALGELGAVADAQAPRAIRYYRDLFAGEASEGLRRDEAARDAYNRALALYPGAQAAHLALARLERKVGDRESERDAVLRVVELPESGRIRDDPWQDYYVASTLPRATVWLERLRDRLRGPQ